MENLENLKKLKLKDLKSIKAGANGITNETNTSISPSLNPTTQSCTGGCGSNIITSTGEVTNTGTWSPDW